MLLFMLSYCSSPVRVTCVQFFAVQSTISSFPNNKKKSRLLAPLFLYLSPTIRIKTQGMPVVHFVAQKTKTIFFILLLINLCSSVFPHALAVTIRYNLLNFNLNSRFANSSTHTQTRTHVHMLIEWDFVSPGAHAWDDRPGAHFLHFRANASFAAVFRFACYKRRAMLS